MAVKNKSIEFANFVFHMGEHRNLLSSFVDYVHPAFFRDMKRVYGESSFSFYDTKIIDLDIDGETLYFLYGRLVKDSVLHQEQIFENKKLVPVDNVFQNAPSSIFILTLKEHRLFFIKETRDAPTLDSLKATFLHFVKTIRTEHIDDLYSQRKHEREERNGAGKALTKKALKKQIPEPELEIIPMSSDAEIEQFIRGLATIELLELDIIRPNNEADLNPLFDDIRKVGNNVGAAQNQLSFKKKDKVSLDQTFVAKYAVEASKDNNVKFKLKGKDLNKDTLTGTNDSFNLKVPIKEELDTPKFNTEFIYRKFRQLINEGLIRQPETDCDGTLTKKIKDIIDIIRF